MNKINDGGPAFPTDADGRYAAYTSAGMTLRDYFAAKAMQGWVASASEPASFDALAEFSYTVADAMLAARGGQ